MEVESDVVVDILLLSGVFFIVYYSLYRRYIVSVMDPLMFYILNIMFSSVLIVYVVEDMKYIVHYFLSQLFLFSGFYYSQNNFNIIKKRRQEELNFFDINLLKYTVYVLFFIYVVSNIVLVCLKGVTLLSDDPTTAKVANFQNGFGIFRKINWGIGNFLSAGIIVLYLKSFKKYLVVLLFILGLFTALDGSKSSLLRIVIIAVLLVYHPYFKQNPLIIKRISKFLPVVVLAIVGVLYSVFSKNADGIGQTSMLFLQRLLYGADSVLFFYRPENSYLLTQYNFLDYLYHISNPILGFFRIVPYQEALGNVMVENTVPEGMTLDVIVGPNTPFYIEGQIYFGYYGAFVYSFIIGCAYSLVRDAFFYLSKGSFFMLALICVFCFNGTNLFIETTLFITTCFDTCLFVLPVYTVVYFMLKNKIVFRKFKFSW